MKNWYGLPIAGAFLLGAVLFFSINPSINHNGGFIMHPSIYKLTNLAGILALAGFVYMLYNTFRKP